MTVEQLNFLSTFAATISAFRTLDALVNAVGKSLAKIIPSLVSFRVVKFEPDSGDATSLAFFSFTRHITLSHESMLEKIEQVYQEVRKNGMPIVVSPFQTSSVISFHAGDLHAPSSFNPYQLVPYFEELEIKEVAAFPLLVLEQFSGAIGYGVSESYEFNADTIEFLAAISAQVEIGINHTLTYEALMRREREMVLETVFGNALAAPKSRDDFFLKVASSLLQLLPFDLMRIRMMREKDIESYICVVRQPDGSVSTSPDDGYSDAGLRHFYQEELRGKPSTVCFSHADMLSLAARYTIVAQMLRTGWQSFAIIVLTLADGTLAGISLVSRNPDGYNADEIGLIKLITPQLKLALENFLYYETLHQRDKELSLQLSLGNTLLAPKSEEDFLLKVARELFNLIAFDSLAIRAIESVKLRKHIGVRRNDTDFQLVPASPVIQVSDIVQFYKDYMQGKTDVFLMNESDMQHYGATYLVIQQAVDMGWKSLLLCALPIHDSLPASLVLASKKPDGFDELDAHAMTIILPQLALAFENMFAFEEIASLKEQLEREKKYLEEEVRSLAVSEQVVGESPEFLKAISKAMQVAPTDSTTLILGETGTGKEVIARVIHESSSRKEAILVKVNCAAIPEGLIESELFGHEKGAFTGAFQRRLGKFELATDGTIFLDEIGDMPLESQTKLLRVLQEGEFERVGGSQTIKTNVRVIAATNANLESYVAEKKFRSDLYYRLNVVPILLPPLRERKKDILPLTLFFIQKFSQKFRKRIERVSEESIHALQAYSFPGNVRELEHLVERAMVVAQGDVLFIDLPSEPSRISQKLVPVSESKPAAPEQIVPLEDFEKHYIISVCEKLNWRIRGKGGVAEVLDINPTTLESRMKKLGITRPK
jgi:formate hydrogenlyase transcriptional activator